MDRLKVLITNSMPFLGGAEKFAWKLGKGLLGCGHKVSFAVKTHSALAELLQSEHLVVHRLPMRGDADPYSLLSMIRLTRAKRTDIILSTCERDFRLAGLATRLGGRGRVIPRLRSVWPPDRKHWAKTVRFCRQRFNYRFFASRIITNSVEGKRDLVEGGWMKEGTVEVVYNGVDLRIFDPARVEKGAVKQQLGISRDATMVTLIARIAVEKGQALFVDVAENLLEDHPHTYFLIVGRPTSQSYYEELLRRLRSSQYGDHILLTGFRDDVESVLADTDILVLPSVEEGLPNVVLEAMAMECPVVATDVCATNEAVEDDVTGYLIPFPISNDLLVGRLRSLIEDRELRRRMGHQGRRKVEGKFDFEQTLRRYEEVFARVNRGKSL
ncbi:MAG: glycosyltransferase family 4 protein [Bacteroidota bacterium]